MTKSLFTGLFKFKVLCINPTQKEAEELGITLKKEPNYISERDGIKNLRIDVYVESTYTNSEKQQKEVKGKITYFISNIEDRAKSSGHYRFIDIKGNNTYAENLSDLENNPYIDMNSARKCLRGENSFINDFVRNYLNAKKDDVLCIENTSELFKENYSELKEFTKIAKGNKIWALAVIRDGKYQDIFPRFILRGWLTNEKLLEAVNKFRENEFNKTSLASLNYSNSFNPREIILEIEDESLVPDIDLDVNLDTDLISTNPVDDLPI